MHCFSYYTLFLPHVPEGVAVFSKNYWHYKWLFLKSSHHCEAICFWSVSDSGIPYWSVDVLSSLPNQLVFSNDALKVKTLLSIKSALEMTKPKKFTPLRSDMFPIVCRYPIQVVIPFMWRRIFPSSVSFFFSLLPS